MEKKVLNRALRLLRTYHQLKQVELAGRLGIANTYLSEIETGSKTPTIEILEKYSEVFKIPVSSILLFSEIMDEPHRTSGKLRVAAADKIVRLLEWIDEREAVTSP
ncbi:MAG: transcriptional regulator Xre family [Gallionellaceae bacterium]|nr:MAG: transcriptional regulator Xre family [Gallionellaceae bacterium]